MPFGRYTCGVQWRVVLDGILKTLTAKGRGDLGVKRQTPNCKLLLPPGDRNEKWFRVLSITLVLVMREFAIHDYESKDRKYDFEKLESMMHSTLLSIHNHEITVSPWARRAAPVCRAAFFYAFPCVLWSVAVWPLPPGPSERFQQRDSNRSTKLTR